MYPTKADRILSRYRPIAPKPASFPSSSSFATDPSSFCASGDSYPAKSKRSRKRRTADPSHASVKTPRVAPEPVPSITAAASSITQGLSSDGAVPCQDAVSAPRPAAGDASDVHWPGCPPVCIAFAAPTGPVVQHGGAMATGAGHGEAMVSGAGYGGALVPGRGHGGPSVTGTAHGGTSVTGAVHNGARMTDTDLAAIQHCGGMVMGFQRFAPTCGGTIHTEKDVVCVERVAAAPGAPLLERVMTTSPSTSKCYNVGYVGGGFTEMIRGITRLPTVADVQSLMQARASANPGCSYPSTPRPLIKDLHRKPSSPSPSSAVPLAVRCPNAAEDAGADCKNSQDSSWVLAKASNSAPDLHSDCRENSVLGPSMVTLSLLPETPTAMDSPPTEGSCTTPTPASTELGLCNIGNVSSAGHHGLVCSTNQRPKYDERCETARYPLLPEALADGLPLNQTYLEQVYGASTDPVLLVDDHSHVLWFNKAYEKASKASFEKPNSGPYIDPLGHPTPLGSFTIHSFGTPTTSFATLWGFLRKLVVQEPELLDNSSKPRFKTEEQAACSFIPSAQCMIEPDVNEGRFAYDPSRLLTVTLESVTHVHLDASPLVESLEAMEAQLAEASMPAAFITDCTSRVKSVNSSFKQMLGHSVCVRDASNGPAISKMEAAPELTFVCSAEKVPRTAAAFSGRVNLEWLRGRKRRSMNVPCDVCRLITDTKSMEMWVWKLDTSASLCL